MPDFSGGTIGGNILPDTTGRDIGSPSEQWDAFLQDAAIYGSLTLDAAASATIANLNGIRNAESFNWSQNPPGSLSAGACTVTLSPVPHGLNATDSNHYVYISGVGTPESVLITGGTAVAGSASGTITFTVANSHAGGYTIGSATLGIAEAISDLPTTGGIVDARSLQGNQTLPGTLLIAKSGVTVLLGSSLILTMGSNNIVIDTTANNVTIEGTQFWGGGTSGGSTATTKLVYTGTGDAISLGNDVDHYHQQHVLRNIVVDISGADSAAVGIHSTRAIYDTLDHVRVVGKSGITTQKGIYIDGGSTTADGGSTQSQGVKIIEPYLSNVFKGVVVGGSAGVANMSAIIGGHILGSGNTTTGSRGVEVSNGGVVNSEFSFFGVEIQSYETGLYMGGTHSWGTLRMEFNGTDINLTAASLSNRFWIHRDANSSGSFVTDSGSRNTVETDRHQFSYNGNTSIKNILDQQLDFVLGSGVASDQNSVVTFVDKSGTAQCDLGKRSDNNFYIRDAAFANRFRIDNGTNAGTFLYSKGSGNIDLNSNNSATGSWRMFGGGASAVASVDNTGKGTFNAGVVIGSSGPSVVSGSASTRNAVRTAFPSVAIGSLYLSTAGKAYVKVANAAADTDWEKVTSSAAD